MKSIMLVFTIALLSLVCQSCASYEYKPMEETKNDGFYYGNGNNLR